MKTKITIFSRTMLVMCIVLAIGKMAHAGVISGTFTTLTNCPQTLSAMCLDPVNGVFYAVGDQSSNAFYKYTISTGTWTTLANAPVTTYNNAGATYLGGKIYISYTGYADLQVYTVSTNTWTTLTGPTGGAKTGSISNDGTNVYIACNGTPGKFWRYNVSGGTWTELASVPKAQPWGGLAYNNGYFYCTEGNSGTAFQKYRVSTDTWTSLTGVPGGAVLGAAIYDAYYYCMGDYGGTNLYSYDLGAEEWNNTLTLPWPINDATICVYGNSLYIIQGEAGTGFSKFTPNNPMLTNIEGTAHSYNLGDPAITVTSTITASQNNGTNFASATVTISSGFQTGKDVLSFTNAYGITGSWSSTTGILTLTGTTTIANYQAALRSVQYYNNDLTSNNAPRVVSFQVYDGSIYSNTANRTILIPGPPTVTTAEVSNITPTSATCGGSVTEDNGDPVTARGVCYNTTGNPTISDPKTTNGTGLGTFTSSMTGLNLGTTYYVKAYATNNQGTNYGVQRTFIPALSYCTPPVSSTPCSYMYITNVSTSGGGANFNNTTGCSATSYTNYSSTISASQSAGSSITMSFTSYVYPYNYGVWVDFDDDGTFESTEKVISYSNITDALTVVTSFTVPSEAPLGSHRMRVRGDYNGSPVPDDPCSALGYGETEDYSFEVGQTAPPNPTSITATVNPICLGGSTQLTANGADGTVYWYTGSCGGTQVTTGNPINVSPTATTTYYARNYNNSQFSTGCASLQVTVYNEVSANISGGVTPICYNTSPGTFTATGSGGTGSYTYLWYKDGSSTGITTQTYNPGTLTTSASFYCAVTSGDCGTANTSTTSITVYGNLTANISGGATPMCYNTSPGTFTATGSGGTGSYTYLWYKDGSSTGVTTQTYNPGALTTSASFYCAVSSGSCGTANTSTTSITVYNNLTANISGGATPICYNTSPGTFTATGSGGNGSYTYLWYMDGSSTGMTTQTYNPGALTSSASFYCAVTSGDCGTVNTSTTSITVYGDLGANISGGTSPICYNTSPGTFNATGSNGTGSYTYLWYKDGSSTGVTTQTYNPGALTTSASFYCAVTSGDCGTVNTGTTSITVHGDLGAGISGGTSPICYNTSPGTFTATGSGGTGSYTYLWYKDGSSTGVTTQTYNPGALTASSDFYCAVTSGSCGTVNTGTTTITVFPDFIVGSISADQAICFNDTPGVLTGVAPTGGNGPYTYQWQLSTDNISFDDITDANALDFQPGALTQTTYYRQRQISASGCGTLTTNTVTILVYPTTLGGEVTGGAVVCYGTNSTLLTLSGYEGSVVKWQYSTNGTDWTDIANTLATYTATNLTVNTWFRAVVKSGVCQAVFSSATQITMFTDFHISGYAKYYNNPKTPLDGLKITLKKGGVQQGTPVNTGANGWFDFGGLTNGIYDIEISSAHSSGQWQTWNGVNNTDFLLVSRHATNVAPLAMEPPVVRVAGDVIVPHPAINTLDANAVRNAARYGWLNPATSQPWFDIPKWVFSGTSSGAPLVAFELSCNNVTRNIYGLCAGDVNGSYIPPSGIKQAEASVDLIAKGSLPVSNEMIFPVRAEHDMEIGAITLMLNFDAQNMEITAVEMPGFTGEQPWFQVNGNQLYIGWMSLDPARVTEGQTLLLIHSRLTAPASSLRFLLDPNPISELADGEGNVLYGAKLSMADAGLSQSPAESAEISVYPNPAKDVLYIEGQFMNSETITVELSDLNGRRMILNSFFIENDGFSKVVLDVSDLAGGVYLLKMSANSRHAVKKVMIQH